MLEIKIKELNTLLRQLQAYGRIYESNVGNSIAKLPTEFVDILTKKIPVSLKTFFSDQEYYIKSAYGQGKVAQTPSISIISKKLRLGKSPIAGEYLVFLFSKDLSKVYFQLAMGVTKLKRKEIIEKREQIRDILDVKDYLFLTQNIEHYLINEKYKDAIIYGNIWKVEDDSYCVNLLNQLTRIYEDYIKLRTSYQTSKQIEFIKTKEPETNYNKTSIKSKKIEFKDLGDKMREKPFNYWWLVANPNYFRFSDIEIGETVDYTIKTDKGNPRRHALNFENARKGDIVIGYEANPLKKIVSLLSVERESNGETIIFKKTEDLIFPVNWSEFKDIQELKDMEFLKNRNGSFFKLSEMEYEILINLIRQNNPESEVNSIYDKKYIEKYTDKDFLEEVFMSDFELENLKQLLKQKKNIVLQGAPGVGKTFTAKRLAFAMMGEKDNSRVEVVQFHQNYSYEDFIMGYKPNEQGGFDLENGVFYEFCNRASSDPEKEYFFIIDEINRGNLSKIFGELLMLIEKGYRGVEVKLPYNKELFSVPQNMFIIGMMNTADRSLAMIDYALRRRFKFYPMKPGFDSESFKKKVAGLDDKRVSLIIEAIKRLNKKISEDDSLGDGFCIGHSYFCDIDNERNWIENIIKYEICPLLDEYWFDDKDRRETEKQRLLELLK